MRFEERERERERASEGVLSCGMVLTCDRGREREGVCLVIGRC